jgi:hypothetical protein
MKEPERDALALALGQHLEVSLLPAANVNDLKVN